MIVDIGEETVCIKAETEEEKNKINSWRGSYLYWYIEADDMPETPFLKMEFILKE